VLHYRKIIFIPLLSILLVSCSHDTEILDEPDYYTKGQDIKKSYENFEENDVKIKVSQKENYQEPKTKTTPSTDSSGNGQKEIILKGQDVKFNDDIYLAVSKQAFDELMNNVIQKNTDATLRMVDRGDLILIKKGTDAYVIDRTISGVAEVEIIKTGLRGFVVVEVLKKK
jgi:hypothetical protein